jgi:hypothetical protein
MLMQTWQRYTSSFERPKRSPPKTKATRCLSPASVAKRSRGAKVGGPKSRGVIAVAQAKVMPCSASPRLPTMRAPASTSVAPLAIATASSRASTSGQRGATSTRSQKPITFIARATEPTLPAWLVLINTNRVGSVARASGMNG